jgi:starch phosphorylase
MHENEPTEFRRRLQALQTAMQMHARYSLAKEWDSVESKDALMSLALTIRDRIVDLVLKSEARFSSARAKRLHYLSMEFLLGPCLRNNLHSLGVFEMCRAALDELGFDLEAICDSEGDPALGNGGLGRLAACFLDSLASLDMPGYGHGINYEYGLFRQEIRKGEQMERPDNWLAQPSPWQIPRPDRACIVPLYGQIVHAKDARGSYNPMWMDWSILVGLPYDMPIVGYGSRTANYLRLYSARASSDFDMAIFNDGDYIKAVNQKISAETVSKVLYPSDSVQSGQELRLIQEYFLVACAVRNIVADFRASGCGFEDLSRKVAIQLNDTHPALTVAELMRLLIDENDVPWERAWETTQAVCGYTNHTLAPEALEEWPVSLLERVIPRHLQIIYEINHRFLQTVSMRWPGEPQRQERMSLIREGAEKKVRMAHLAIVGSHSVNGVSALHSSLVKSHLVPDFHAFFPGRFNNKTNGVTPRRWILSANPGLAKLIDRVLGREWVTDLGKLRALEPYARDASFLAELRGVKRANKERLAKIVRKTAHVNVSPDSLFDVQAKRIHEYKRQLLNVLRVVHEYIRMVDDRVYPAVARTCIFAGKAAPGYWTAKQIIKLVNAVGDVVNNDSRTRDLLKVAFLPDYRVSLAEAVIPAADLSEQISTAGMEASGTGNMKFSMNGALTIGTLDGANVEIREEVGAENFYLFGLTTEEVLRRRRENSHRPWEFYHQDSGIRRVLDSFRDGRFSPRGSGEFDWVPRLLLDQGDHYLHLADFQSYVNVQDQVSRDYTDTATWARKALINVARMGKFSSDRTIQEYADGIWGISSLPTSEEVSENVEAEAFA